MKLATVLVDSRRSVAIVDAENRRVSPLPQSLGACAQDMLALVEAYDSIRADLKPTTWIDLDRVTLEAPLPKPRRNIFCVGKNYRAHAQEFASSGYDSTASANGDAVPQFPIIFSKVPECVVGDGVNVRYPHGVSSELDYEAELAVIIGKGGLRISKKDALSHVWGYSIINDMTARDLQERHKQWLIGKSLDTFGPMGPWITTADDVDVGNMGVRCWINGELRQDANTADLIFDIPTLIETISAGITLYPGDIIATGTPAGVGIGFSPPRFLQPGDSMEIEIDGLGRLTNAIA